MHLNSVRRPVRKVPSEWLPLAVQIGKQVNLWSRRKDLTAYVAMDGHYSGAAAAYFPRNQEIEVDAGVCFSKVAEPALIGDFTLRETHFDYPMAAGVILHEAMHAQYTINEIFDRQGELTRADERQWYFDLEEPRIEGLGVRQYPENREFLRASALGIALEDSKGEIFKMTGTEAAASLALLAMGRVDAGVLKPKDIKTMRKVVRKIIPTPVLKELRALWREFIDLQGPGSVTRMLEIAREYARIVREQAAKERTAAKDSGKSDEELSKELLDLLKELLDAMRGDALGTSFDAKEEIHNTRQAEASERAQKEKRAEVADQSMNQQMAKETFQDSSIHAKPHRSNSRKVGTRPPRPEERAVANKIAKAMEKAKYRDRVVTKHAVSIPPGRLHAGTAMQGAAIKRNGGSATTEPWRVKRHHNVEDPNLTIGIMCDISGSMSQAMEPMGVSAWVMSAAAQRIKATAAAVYFGGDVFSVLNPGQYIKDVNIYSAADATEQFDKGFRALDGGLNLLHGHGARMLVVCSDGQFGGEGQRDAAVKWLKLCKARGVAVLWLDYRNSPGAAGICRETGATLVIVGKSVIDAANAIGSAATSALSAASAY
jgi:hypothetical protein